MRDDEAVDNFASMFQAGFAAEPERMEKRLRSEKRSTQSAKQRKRGAVRTTQINYRCSPPHRKLAAGLAKHLSDPERTVSTADLMEDALIMYAKAMKFDGGE
jgi:hypothetical protein